MSYIVGTVYETGFVWLSKPYTLNMALYNLSPGSIIDDFWSQGLILCIAWSLAKSYGILWEGRGKNWETAGK